MKKHFLSFAVAASLVTFGMTSCGSNEAKMDDEMSMSEKDGMNDENMDNMDNDMQESLSITSSFRIADLRGCAMAPSHA